MSTQINKNIKNKSNIKVNIPAVNNIIINPVFKLSYLWWASNIKVNVSSRRLEYPSANLGSSTATMILIK